MADGEAEHTVSQLETGFLAQAVHMYKAAAVLWWRGDTVSTECLRWRRWCFAVEPIGVGVALAVVVMMMAVPAAGR